MQRKRGCKSFWCCLQAVWTPPSATMSDIVCRVLSGKCSILRERVVKELNPSFLSRKLRQCYPTWFWNPFLRMGVPNSDSSKRPDLMLCGKILGWWMTIQQTSIHTAYRLTQCGAHDLITCGYFSRWISIHSCQCWRIRRQINADITDKTWKPTRIHAINLAAISRVLNCGLPFPNVV